MMGYLDIKFFLKSYMLKTLSLDHDGEVIGSCIKPLVSLKVVRLILRLIVGGRSPMREALVGTAACGRPSHHHMCSPLAACCPAIWLCLTPGLNLYSQKRMERLFWNLELEPCFLPLRCFSRHFVTV